MIIRKIVVTGGPCAGKTSALTHIRALAEHEGYRVLTVAETATELIAGGVAPWSCATADEYQAYQFDLQRKKEEIFLKAACGMACDRVLILCDRGLLDNRAYMTEEAFFSLLSTQGETVGEIMDSYDAVFHLVTAALDGDAFYTVENNCARIETAEEARAVDQRLLAAWKDHPRRYVIESAAEFSDKLARITDLLLPLLREDDK